jgi:hypothetical protein
MVAAEIIRSPIDKANHTLLNLANSLKRGKPRQVAAFFISETGPTSAIGTSRLLRFAARCRLSGAKRTSGLVSQNDANDPLYGPAVRSKRISLSWRWAVLHQCIRPLIGALLLAIMDISAHAASLSDRPRWARWVTSVRMCREDRTSISSHPLADLGG